MSGPQMLGFRENVPKSYKNRSTEKQQSHKGNQALTPNVMAAKRCQIQDYGSAAVVRAQSTAPRSASDVHGAATERTAGLMDCPDGGGEPKKIKPTDDYNKESTT